MREAVDVVLLDIHMPEMPGLTSTGRPAALPQPPYTPITRTWPPNRACSAPSMPGPAASS